MGIRHWLGQKWPERGLWDYREAIHSEVDVLKAALTPLKDQFAQDPMRLSLVEEALKQLAVAGETVKHSSHPRFKVGRHLVVAQTHLNAACTLWARVVEPKEVAPFVAGLTEFIAYHLHPKDARRAEAEKIAAADPTRLDRAQVETLMAAAGVAKLAALNEKLRVGSFVRIVAGTTVALAVGAVLVALLTAISPTAVPLCFYPQPQLEEVLTVKEADKAGNVDIPPYRVVCPTASEKNPDKGDRDEDVKDVASRLDYITVEAVGLVAAGIAAASALRRIRGTSTPYNVPVALAALKLPTGALTAVLGLLLMRGGFVPGLSALDSSEQIIAWAIVFGYSQQLFTTFVDRQGQAVLDAVRGPTAPPP